MTYNTCTPHVAIKHQTDLKNNELLERIEIIKIEKVEGIFD